MSRILAKKAFAVGFGSRGWKAADPGRFVNIYLDQDCVRQYRNDLRKTRKILSFGARPMMPPPT
jgi:hypothetical protein